MRTLLNHSFSFYQPNLAQELFFTEKAQLLPQTYGIYSYKDVLYLGPLKKVLIVEISLVSQYNIFLHWILCDITYTCIIHLTQYIDKTYSVKQMCASVLLKLNIKLFFGIKHNTQIKRYAIRRKMNVCKHIFFLFLAHLSTKCSGWAIVTGLCPSCVVRRPASFVRRPSSVNFFT